MTDRSKFARLQLIRRRAELDRLKEKSEFDQEAADYLLDPAYDEIELTVLNC